jgi:hypothetical protein
MDDMGELLLLPLLIDATCIQAVQRWISSTTRTTPAGSADLGAGTEKVQCVHILRVLLLVHCHNPHMHTPRV